MSLNTIFRLSYRMSGVIFMVIYAFNLLNTNSNSNALSLTRWTLFGGSFMLIFFTPIVLVIVDTILDDFDEHFHEVRDHAMWIMFNTSLHMLLFALLLAWGIPIALVLWMLFYVFLQYILR